ncbi:MULTISPECIES: ATP-binding protein [unclassified Sphingomonas]|jgi:signal transduction histidine kinase|nr:MULTISPECIES: ATP-binding protein [unclassified Sphingomonas]
MRRFVAAVLLLATIAGHSTAALAASGVRGRFDGIIGATKAAMLSDPKLAADMALRAERSADAAPPSRDRDVMRATARWLRGEALLRVNDMAAAKPLIASAVELAQKVAPGSSLLGEALLTKGWINSVEVRPAEALDNYQTAFRIFQRAGEVRNQAMALQAIGALYTTGRDYAGALKYYEQSIDIYDADPNLLLSAYNNRGNLLRELKRYRESEQQFHQALALAERLHSGLLRTMVLGNIAETQLAGGNVHGAQRNIDEALHLARKAEASGFRPLLEALAAQAALQRGDLPSAERLIGRRFAGQELTKTTVLDRTAHKTAYDIYRAAGRDDLALAHLAALKRLDDEATDLARSTSAALMAARFDFANQELRIANLQRDEARRGIAYAQARAKTQQTIFVIAGAATALVIALLAVGLFTIRRSRNQVRAAAVDLAVTNSALAKALAAKTEFLATTSHEIRTPLNGILGMTQVMLADPGLPRDIRDRVGIVHGAGVTMRALVDDILDVAKMETGNLTIEVAPFDLAAMLVDASRMWEEQARAKGIGFTRDLTQAPARIMGDVARLRQIVFNLMSNALKFTETGSVTVHAAAVGDRLRIVVADTGIGIAPDKRDHIFETFRQADTSTTRRFGGTGLGLAICRNLARAMDGDVTVESEPGVGSRFTVDLPLTLADPTQADSPVVGTEAMLIVDRNPITRAMLKSIVEAQGAEVALAGTLDAAIERLAAGGVARLLVDEAVLGGGDVMAANLHRLRDAAGGRPIALLAGNAPDWPAADMSVIAKPISAKALADMLFPVGNLPLVSQAA